MQKYRIRHMTMIDDDYGSPTAGEPFYWSNEYGWTTYDSMYTKFTEDEMRKFDLPDEGTWEEDGLDVSVGIDERDPFYVSVYRVGQGYGGPEEGGWWFLCGDLVKVVIASSEEEADEIRDKLYEEYQDTGKRYSVLGGEDYEIYIKDKFPPDYFPERAPRYS